MKFKTQFSDYQIVETKDGSFAIHSDAFDENSHSTEGAKSETLYNFVEANDLTNFFLQKRASKDASEVNILEVGFGIGNGLAVTYDYWKDIEIKPLVLNFYSQEIDPQLIEYAFSSGPYCETLRELTFDKLNSTYIYKIKSANTDDSFEFRAHIIVGDARKSIFNFKDKYFDFIFQDAYSPSKNPYLWTLEWFEALFLKSKDNCSLSTYSASARIRKSMVRAGWKVFNRKGFAKKRSMTVAKKGNYTDHLNESIEKSKIEVLRDEELK